MCNLGRVSGGKICFDPFVGTGSILVTASVFNGICIGTDIDVRVLRGKGGNNTINATFTQFGFPRPELIRSDNSMYGRHFRGGMYSSGEGIYDCIICDPPYGIRAGAKKSGTKREVIKPVADEHRGDHIAQTQNYEVCDVMSDLMDVAAMNLKVGGRLVYLIPTTTEFDEEMDLPTHKCLALKYCCFQGLQIELGRRMVCMEKICSYESSKADEYRAAVWPRGLESARKVSNMREQLIEKNQLRKKEEREKELKETGKLLSKRERKRKRREENREKLELSSSEQKQTK